ncbi:MAG: prevent-host-death protein [Opitutaceae bacterium]|nr:prevent-host-death protein [Opitutaceae bacterium]
MKTATVRQLRTEFPKVLSWVNAGQDVAITRRKQIVASLVPAGNPPKRKTSLPDFRARLRRIYGDKVIPAAVMADILAENKGRF